MTITAECKNCFEEIMYSGRAWVETRSGDDGGFYDICPDSPEEDGYGVHIPV